MLSEFDDWLALHTLTVHTPVAGGDGWNGGAVTDSTSTGMLDARMIGVTKTSDGAQLTSMAQFHTTLDQLPKFKEEATIDLPGGRVGTVISVAVTQINDPDLDGITVMMS